MTDHDGEMAAVLAEALQSNQEWLDKHGEEPHLVYLDANPVKAAVIALAALTAAGYAVVEVPEGVEVAHGARLVVGGRWNNVYAIEATP